jgi:hypothetical protein
MGIPIVESYKYLGVLIAKRGAEVVKEAKHNVKRYTAGLI